MKEHESKKCQPSKDERALPAEDTATQKAKSTALARSRAPVKWRLECGEETDASQQA